MAREKAPFDGNQAAAEVAHAVNEVCAIYPITPSSDMGEFADAFSAAGRKNIWGSIPTVAELQSEGGAAGAVHGSLASGAMTTTFTASQGLLLMIPNMFKIAGELTPTVFHVSARTVATHALSIFGDHSDVMACRSTGWAMIASSNVQEAHDIAAISHMATLEADVPFLHFFDGFRTSHEIQKIEMLGADDLRALVNHDKVDAFRARGLSPDHPTIKGTAQNPDVFFQLREVCNSYYDACPGHVQAAMDKFAKLVGRQYKLFDYYGAPDAERVVIIMGSGADCCKETVDYLVKQGEKIGVLVVRLYRPFSAKAFVAALPKTARKFAVLDRTKEPGALGEPLYEDVRTAFGELMGEDKALFGGAWPVVVGGRYGLSSKEFTPAMVKAVYDGLKADKPRNHFTVGINDDLNKTSLDVDHSFIIEPADVSRCVFYGLGSDGTVGANQASIKIIADNTDNYAQGYFVYDSKKAGGITTSHLRFGPRPIQSTYLINHANFVACHLWTFLEKYDMLSGLAKGGVFLLNSPYSKDEVWQHLPKKVQEQLKAKEAKFYIVDADQVAQATGMGTRINTVMQTCFFKIANVINPDKAIELIKKEAEKNYARKGMDVVKKNWAAIDDTLANLHQVDIAKLPINGVEMPRIVSADAPAHVQDFMGEIMAGRGEGISVATAAKVSKDGTFPTATTQWEKRNIAREIPVWEPDLCIQCAKCSAVCPHAVIRLKIYDPKALEGAPATFKSSDARGPSVKGMKCTVQVFPEDCTGCGACVYTCPAKDKANPERKAINMAPQLPLREAERANADFFLKKIPETAEGLFPLNTLKGSQLRRPLFEFSGACAGCGETPYIKLATQLFGDRMVIANATGCTSIYGGNLPTTPYCVDHNGRGPAWANSLFEDNAEFGYGMRLAADKFKEQAKQLLQSKEVAGCCFGDNEALIKATVDAVQDDAAGIEAQRERVALIKKAIGGCTNPACKRLLAIADYLVKKSVWIFGGDGWAYDIGYGGLDHVLASGANVNVLVLDTEVYSNTGGQASKSTPMGAVARFAEGGKRMGKKDMAMIAMTYGNIYVAKVSMAANDGQTVKAFLEAESYNGPSLILAYAHCIAHGIKDMADGKGKGFEEQKRAVECGHWPLMRFDPRLLDEGKNPLQLDSKVPTLGYKDWAKGEGRFQQLFAKQPEVADQLATTASNQEALRLGIYQQLAQLQIKQ